MSYLEIYNEVLKDLLNPTDKQLKIREHPEMGIYVVCPARRGIHTFTRPTSHLAWSGLCRFLPSVHAHPHVSSAWATVFPGLPPPAHPPPPTLTGGLIGACGEE